MITDNYIKMCEKNEDLQKAWNPKFGDYCQLKEYKSLMIVMGVIESHDIRCISYKYRRTGYGAERYLKDNLIYLPTQEQLQEMINAFSNYERINRFYEFVHLDADEYGYKKWCEFVNDASMNELWLAFVMYEKYHKTWTGEKWVKAE